MIYKSSYPELGPISENTNIYEFIFGTRGSPLDTLALSDDSDRITYRHLHELTTRIGGGWIENAGLEVGDVVMLVALANPAYGPEEFSHSIDLVQAKIVVTTDASVQQVSSIGVKRSQIVLFGPKSKENDALPEFRELALDSLQAAQHVLQSSGASSLRSDSLAAICFSSGTTGLPKGVALNHKNLIAESISLSLTPGFRAEPEPILNCLPAFHIAGLESILYALSFRDTVHFAMRALFDIVFVAKKMQELKIGRMLFVPPILLGLLRHPSTKNMKFPHIRNICVGAAPLGPDLHKEAQEKLGIPIIQVWGLSETTGAVTMSSPDNKKAPYGSAGMVCSGAELRLVDVETGRDVEEFQQGEIWVKSPVNFPTYYRNEKATKQTYEGEWFKTGDIGIMAKSGDLFIVDRLKELLKYKGMQVAPAELEDVLLSHNKVGDAAVVGIRDSDGNDLARAYIVPQPGTDFETAGDQLKKEVSEYVASKLAPFKHLRGGVMIVKEIPKNPSGKILRRILRDQAMREVASKL